MEGVSGDTTRAKDHLERLRAQSVTGAAKLRKREDHCSDEYGQEVGG